MASSFTTLYQFTKPEVGASADVWGGFLNNDFDDLDALSGAMTLTGSSSAYVLTTGLSLAAYVSGQRFLVKWNHTNGTTPTLAVDGLAAKNIKKRDASTAPSASDLVSGTFAFVCFDGTNFVLMTPVASDFQARDGTLDAFAALSWSSLTPVVQFTAADTISLTTAPATTSVTGGTASNGITLTASALTRNNVAGSMTIEAGTNAGNSIQFKTNNANKMAVSDSNVQFNVAAVPASNDGAALGTVSLMWSDLILATGGVLNWNNGNFTLTHVTGGIEASGTVRGRIARSSETGGALTAASAGKKVVLATAPSIAQNVFVADDSMVLVNNTSSSMTLTQTSGTQRTAGTTTTGNITLPAYCEVVVDFTSATEWIVAGA